MLLTAVLLGGVSLANVWPSAGHDVSSCSKCLNAAISSAETIRAVEQIGFVVGANAEVMSFCVVVQPDASCPITAN